MNAFPGDGKDARPGTPEEQNIAGTGLIDQIALALFEIPILLKEDDVDHPCDR